MDQKEKKLNTLTLALGIALLPPLWAVFAPHIGISTGAVALICAGLFVANGNQYHQAPKICIGFLLGDCWAVLALFLMNQLKLNPDLELFLTLFLLGGAAVFIATAMEQFIFLPSWLCGWAIGLTIMAPAGYGKLTTLPMQIGGAMIVGVFYVGVGVDLFQKLLLHKMKTIRKNEGKQ